MLSAVEVGELKYVVSYRWVEAVVGNDVYYKTRQKQQSKDFWNKHGLVCPFTLVSTLKNQHFMHRDLESQWPLSLSSFEGNKHHVFSKNLNLVSFACDEDMTKINHGPYLLFSFVGFVVPDEDILLCLYNQH